MFGRKKDDEAEMGAKGPGRAPDDEDHREAARPNGDEDSGQAPPLKPFSRRGSHAPSKPPTSSSFSLDPPRRTPDIPSGPTRRVERPRASGDLDSRRLLVGRDIQLAGEITACDKLVVEGRVEVTISNARVIEIAPSGVFKGQAEVDEADIAGRFEGELVARDRLTVRSGGRVRGSIRYGKIVIESGGEISGDMQTLSPEDAAARQPTDDPDADDPAATDTDDETARADG